VNFPLGNYGVVDTLTASFDAVLTGTVARILRTPDRRPRAPGARTALNRCAQSFVRCWSYPYVATLLIGTATPGMPERYNISVARGAISAPLKHRPWPPSRTGYAVSPVCGSLPATSPKSPLSASGGVAFVG
jgi:hypothetical protein